MKTYQVGKGLRVKCFLSDCGDVLTAPRGAIASPNWPRHYSHHVNCTWTVIAPVFKVRVTSVLVPVKCIGCCPF